MDRLIHPALEGLPVAWFSPTYKLLADTWRELRTALEPVTRDKSEQEKRIELISGGAIELWSLDSSDAARGRKYAVVVIDEAAMIASLEEAWQQSIRPTLTDFSGEAWFLSTPKGMNYFKILYDRGQNVGHGEWVSWQMPTSANPFIDPIEIESAGRDLTEAAFNQEYLALFVNWEGSVFRRVGESATASRLTEPELGHDYVIGCDWGRSNDYTVFVVLDTTVGAMAAMDRSNRVDYAIQRGRLQALCERWHPRQILAEENSIGQVVIEQLMRDGLRIQPFTTSNASKAQAVEALALAFERGEIRILNDPVLVSELVAYQAERLPSGLMRYTAPSGQHDDCVMALAIAWSAVAGQHRALYPIPESDLVVEPFEIPHDWPRAYGLDVGPFCTAAIWGAVDAENDVVYLYHEYIGADCAPLVHAEAIRNRGGWIPGLLDPTADGRHQTDGYRLIKMYRELGLNLTAVEDLVDSGTMEVLQRMSLGRLKVFASLKGYWNEFRCCGRRDKGRIATEGVSLQNATRVLMVNGISRMSKKPTPKDPRFEPWYRDDGWRGSTRKDSLGWME